MACHVVAYASLQASLVELCGIRVGDRRLIAPACRTVYVEGVLLVRSFRLFCLFFLLYMDDHADHATPQLDGLPFWVSLMDTLYSHSLLLPEVPLHSAAVELWLSRLVEIEVHNFVLLVFWRSPLSRIGCLRIPTSG
jgi:hypothetical protein